MPKDRLRLTRWFLFTIIASIVPFVFLALGYRWAKHPEHIWLLFRKGELLLVSFGLAAGSVAAVGYTLVAVFDVIRFEYNSALVDFGSIALFVMMTICSGITAKHSRI